MKIMYKWCFCVLIAYILLFAFISTAEAFPYKGYDILMSATLSQLYDSNIFFDDDDDDDSKTDGYKVNGAVNLSLRRSGRRGYFNMTGGIRRGIYYNLSEVDSGSENLAINFVHDFSQSLRVKMNNIYYHSTEPYSFYEEFYRETGRYDLHRNTFNVSLQKDVTKNFFLDTNYSHTNIWRDESSLEDYSSDTIRLGLNYRHGADNTYYLSYNLSESNHENSDDTTYHQIRAGIKKLWTFRTSMIGYVGFGFRDSGAGLEDAGNSISVSLDHMINRTTTSRLDLYWGDFLFNEDDVFRKNWRISGNLDRAISEKSNVTVNVFYGDDDTNDFLGIGGNFRYQYSSRINGDLGLYYSSSSQENGEGYSRNIARLGVTYSY